MKSKTAKTKSKSTKKPYYRVWVEIEELDGNGEPTGNDLGVSPDPLGSFTTLKGAKCKMGEIATAFGDELAQATSDCCKLKSKPHKSKKPLTPVEIFLDGLDAGMDGRGYGEEHEKARLLLEAAPDLLAALKVLLSTVDRENERIYGTPLPSDGSRDWKEQADARAAIRKTELRATT